jgi:hypothetical protein
MTKMPILKSLAVAVVLSVFLSGCYIPIRFDAEIEIHRTGAYDMKFDGYLAKVELYKAIRERKIGPAEEKKQAEMIKADFARDPSAKEYKYFKKGHFKVNWHRNGDLIRNKSVSFFNSTSEYIIGIRYNKKNRRITMTTKSVKKSARKQLREIGLDWSGKIRVFTDAKVLSHNATSVKKNKRLGGRFMTYSWDIKNNLAPTSKLVIQIY